MEHVYQVPARTAAMLGKKPQRAQVTFETGGVEIIDRLAEGWRRLCDESNADHPFCRPEFVGAFARAFVPDARLTVVTASIDGRLKAILPLLSRREWFSGLPSRQFEGVSGVHSCRFDLVTAAGVEGDAALEAIWRALKGNASWDMICISNVPENGAAKQLVNLAAADGYAVSERQMTKYPFIPLQGGGAEPWARELDCHFRKNLRRAVRQLQQQGELRLVWLEKADPMQLQKFYEVEGAGWKGKEGTAIICHADTRRFYDEIAREAARFGYFSLHQLYLNDHLLGAAVGFEYKGCYYGLKAGYDEAYRSASPGHVLIEYLLQDCSARGLSKMDFGPYEEYKSKWTPHNLPSYEYVIYRNSSYGRFLHGVRFRVLRPVRAALKRVLKRGNVKT